MALPLEDPADIGRTDDDLVARFHAGDELALDALLHRYHRFARARARSYFLVGADSDDIEQEGLIGLYKAVRSYRPEREAGFRSFAELCIRRQVISAIKTANRRKHQPMHRYVSISGVCGGESQDERDVEVLLDDHHVTDPADEVCQREHISAMHAKMHELLTGLEVEVLGLYVEGRSYQEISRTTGRHVKAIDNALQRIKRKVEQHVADAAAAERAEEAAFV